MISLAILIQVNLYIILGSFSTHKTCSFAPPQPYIIESNNSFQLEPSVTNNFFYSVYSIDTDSLQLEKLHRKARSANHFGLAALATLFVPLINLISLPLAVIAIVKGIKAKRQLPADDPMKQTATKAIIAGALTIALIGVAVYFLIRLY